MKYEVSQNLDNIDDLQFIINELKYSKNLSERFAHSIRNAWLKGAYLDKRNGIVFVDRDYLHILLRIKKELVNYYLAILGKSSEKYISGADFISLISTVFEKTQTFKKRDYIRYSEQLYYIIRDSDKAQILWARYQEILKDERSKLKSKRIKKYFIQKDELTGEALISNTAEFSHIRSVALHSDLQLEIENGLIVNKETHEIITKENVQNEDDLYSLCIKNNWNINWYDYYRKLYY